MNIQSKINQARQEEMFAHVENFRESKLTQKEYCQRYGLGKDEIYYWIKKYERLQNPATNKFIAVEICKPTLLSENKLTIHYPSGVQISLSTGTDISFIRSLITISH
jgi:hypothetical protein